MGKELEAVKAEKVTLRIHGEEREIKFNFSAWAEIEKEYGGFKNVRKLQKDLEETPFTTLPHILYIGLVNKKPVEKDGEVYEITEKNILDDYGFNEMKYVSDVLGNALWGSLPDDEKKAVKEAKKE